MKNKDYILEQAQVLRCLIIDNYTKDDYTLLNVVDKLINDIDKSF